MRSQIRGILSFLYTAQLVQLGLLVTQDKRSRGHENNDDLYCTLETLDSWDILSWMQSLDERDI